MEFNKNQINITKGVAILFMLLLHLFCTKEYIDLFKPLIIIGDTPFIYYLALFGDCCVPIYCFCSGYGLLIGYKNNKETYMKKNLIRILKLYINYWIVLIIFVLGLGFIMNKSNIYLGDLKTFILTFTAIDPAYNGAWWFVTIYIILVLLSPIINKIVTKYNSYTILSISLIIYLVGYVQRIKVPIVFNNEVLDLIIRQLALFGTSQLPYVAGAIFAEHKIYSKLYNIFKHIKLKNILCISLIIAMVIGHGFVQTLAVAPFTGIAFICLFNLIDKPRVINDLLSYLSRHSTNMWLTHMFFYMIYFKDLVYAPKYPVLIFIWLIVLCLASSYLIDIIYRPIIKKLEFKVKDKQIVYQ